MVFPTDDPNLKKMDLSKIADVILRTEQHDDDTTTHNRANYALIFALQTPLMLLSLTVAAFLAGLFSVVFNRLGSNLLWGDDTKVCKKKILILSPFFPLPLLLLLLLVL